MTIFAVIKQPGTHSEQLRASVASGFPNLNYELSGDAWLVAGLGTAKDVSDRLGVTDGSQGSAVVLEVGSYFGRANPAIWTWIKSNWEARVVD